MPGLSDEILYDLQNKRSEEAFEIFFRHYYSRLMIWAHRFVHDPQVAEDIVQDFFLDFWHNKRYDSIRTDPTAYCYRIIRNASIKHLSRKIETTDIDSLENIPAINDGDKMDWELRQKIYMEIDNLPEKCREVFVHCVLYGKTYRDTAEDLGVSINTVRTHMSRAFKTLRERLLPVFRP